MIGPGGTFDYEISVNGYVGTENIKWFGRGKTLREKEFHPGSFGFAPEFELFGGLMTLRSTETEKVKRKNKWFVRYGISDSESFQVGEAIAAAIMTGDTLLFYRSGGGEYGISLMRNNRLVLAMGDIVGAFLGAEVGVGVGPSLQQLQGPVDLFRGPIETSIKVVIQNHVLILIAGQEAVVDPYYVFVERNHTVGGEHGQGSILSIAHLSEKLTREMVRRCTKNFTNL